MSNLHRLRGTSSGRQWARLSTSSPRWSLRIPSRTARPRSRRTTRSCMTICRRRSEIWKTRLILVPFAMFLRSGDPLGVLGYIFRRSPWKILSIPTFSMIIDLIIFTQREIIALLVMRSILRVKCRGICMNFIVADCTRMLTRFEYCMYEWRKEWTRHAF